MHPRLTPVVMSGGSGTRLWPLSRETQPKQFLPLGNHNATTTLLQDTTRRLDGLDASIERTAPIIVCNHEHRFLAAQQLHDAGIHHAKLILEPFGRNTAPALTLAALAAQPDDILLAMPADHVMTRPEHLHAAVLAAWPLAVQQGAMITFGIVADRPETGYGYICQAQPLGDGPACAIAHFAEKPSPEQARQYLDNGSYLWNSGLFMVRASQWLKALAALQPGILAACQAAIAHSQTDHDFIRPDAKDFAACPSDSIDYAVMEHLPAQPELGIPACVLPLDAGWSDLGAWDALWDILPRDAAGNANSGSGHAIAIDTHNSLIHAETCLVATVGVSNLIVVETPDAILVADKSQAQHVKQIVTQLKTEQRPLASTHRKVHRPWGWYDSIDAGERFQVKRIVVNPGAQLSLQMHHHRAEHWVVVRGTAEVTNGDKTFLLTENQSTFIPQGHAHRLGNPGKVPLELIEVQSGSYLGEDDIVRYDDNYGRTTAPAETP